MATFTYAPDNTVPVTPKPRVRKITFGDGYEQRSGSGINLLPREWALTFNTRTKAERDLIVGFLDARGGIEAFDWTPPEAVASVKVVCDSWPDSRVRANIYNITATFRQVFEA